MVAILSKIIQNLDKNVRIFNGSSFQMVGTIALPFESWTIRSTIFKKSRFRMVGIEISTVLGTLITTSNCSGRDLHMTMKSNVLINCDKQTLMLTQVENN